MARKFGGQYSPGASNAAPSVKPAPSRIDPVGARSNVLFLPPLILAFSSLTSGAAGLVIGLTGAGLLALGAWLLREGLRATAAYDARTIARRPALPRKILAAVFCGAGTAVAAFANEPGVVAPLLYGAAAGVLHLGAFGIDPLRDKGGVAASASESERVARVVDEAEAYLSDLGTAGRATGDRAVEARIDQLSATVRGLIQMVENDPRDLTAARRYLGVYLMAARDAAQKYAALVERGGQTRAARDSFVSLIGDLEGSFAQKTQTLLTDDAADLDIEISVLRDRLDREGVRAPGASDP